jgi:hypothetical protein
MNESEVVQQSRTALKQWREQWERQSKENSKWEMKPLNDFINHGVGKAIVLVGNGYSLEENIEDLKEHQDNVDIMCCDKSLGHLIENGITPQFCIVCDANVNFEYMEKYQDQLQDTILFMNVCANPEWADNGNWKDKYFFVNKDVLKSEDIFIKLSGCQNVIPAATNVSNAMVVFATQCDDKGGRNFMGYDKIILLGYDYSWRLNDKYYAFDKEAKQKTNYMRHMLIQDRSGQLCYTSTNLHFSAKWLTKYLSVFPNIPVVSGSSHTLLQGIKIGDFKQQIQYSYKREDNAKVKEMSQRMTELQAEVAQLQNELVKIGRDHYMAYKLTV